MGMRCQANKKPQQVLRLYAIGAGGRNRTGMPLRASDFESEQTEEMIA